MGGTDKPVLRFVSEALFATITTDKRRVAAATQCHPFLYAVALVLSIGFVTGNLSAFCAVAHTLLKAAFLCSTPIAFCG